MGGNAVAPVCSFNRGQCVRSLDDAELRCPAAAGAGVSSPQSLLRGVGLQDIRAISVPYARESERAQ